MMKHSRKFKLVPADDLQMESAQEFNPTPPILNKLIRLDQELRMILEDPTMSEKDKMERYESTLMKWGKYYRQYQNAESGGDGGGGGGGGRHSVNSTNYEGSSSSSNNNSNLTSTAKATLFAATPTPFRNPSPLARSTPLINEDTDLSYGTPLTSRLGEEEEGIAENRSRSRKKKQHSSPKPRRPLTPQRRGRYSQRLLDRGGKQIGFSWLSWRGPRTAR